jgi:TetR/AcrR family transcriptional regulator
VTTSTRPSRRQRERLRHREEILAAAQAVFSEKGYVSATMEEIAARSEYALATVYNLFGNKSELYSETVLLQIERFRTEVRSALAQGETPREKVARYFACRMELFWHDPQFFRFFHHGPLGAIADAHTGFLPEVRRRYERVMRQLRDIFNEGIARGEFRPLGGELLALGLEALLRVYVETLSEREGTARSQEAEQNLLDLFLKGAAA